MQRKTNIIKKAAGGAFLGGGLHMMKPSDAIAAETESVVIERSLQGQPHKGKVFAVIGASVSDIPYFASGTCKKLINEGYTGYLIRTSNDEMIGDGTTFQNIHRTETENAIMAKALGIKEVFNLYYQHHRLDNRMPTDIRARLIFIFRTIKADTVITYLPSDFDDGNPDRWVTFRAVEQAALMAGIKNNYSEYFDAGLTPHPVKELYYAIEKPWQLFNRIVDVGSTIEQKIDAITGCKTQGEGGRGSLLREKLAREGMRLPLLGNDDKTADREYVRQFLVAPSKQLGVKYGLQYAEKFYYIDRRKPGVETDVEEYIKMNAVKV
ncbi:PIG-L deacetylase family protein [Candidatus Latescibacterota bacterium]